MNLRKQKHAHNHHIWDIPIKKPKKSLMRRLNKAIQLLDRINKGKPELMSPAEIEEHIAQLSLDK